MKYIYNEIVHSKNKRTYIMSKCGGNGAQNFAKIYINEF